MLSLGCFVDAVIVEPAPPVIDDVAALTRRSSGVFFSIKREGLSASFRAQDRATDDFTLKGAPRDWRHPVRSST
jgi:hypothetical protein